MPSEVRCSSSIGRRWSPKSSGCTTIALNFCGRAALCCKSFAANRLWPEWRGRSTHFYVVAIDDARPIDRMKIDMELREAERLAGILRWPQIIEKCRTVLLHAPDNFPANLWLARALAASGRPLESTAAFRAAIEAHRPESCEAR